MSHLWRVNQDPDELSGLLGVIEMKGLESIIDVGLAGYLVEPDGALDGGAGEGREVQGGGVHQVETEPRRLPDHHN
jgi:hypothetical protein